MRRRGRNCVSAGLALAVWALGCGEGTPGPAGGSRVRLAGRVLVGPTEGHPMPERLLVAGDVLIAAGSVSDTLLYVFRRATGALLMKAGRAGDGPGEFRFVGSMQARQDGNGASQVLVYDSSLGRFSSFAVHETGLSYLTSTRGYAGWYEALFLADDSTLIALPPFKQHRVEVLDTSGTPRATLAVIPETVEPTVLTVAYQAFEPTPALKPDGRFVALGARYAGRLDLYSLDGREHFMAETPDPFPPLLDTYHNGAMALLRLTGKTRFGYIALAASDARLYALFSGRTMAECHQCAWYGGEVHVFDWRGALVRVLALDADAVAIAVSPDDQDLYAAGWDPYPAIRQYRLRP